jgi:3-phytase
VRAYRGLFASALVLIALGLLFWPAKADAADGRLKLLGQYVYPTKADVHNTTVGGLSGITYDAARNVYYAISDDRSEYEPARFYTLEIDVKPDGIGGVRFTDVTFLDSKADEPDIEPYQMFDIDPEEIVLLPNDELLVSSERDRFGRPWIRKFALDGTLLDELPIPDRFMTVRQPGPDGRPVVIKGIRANLGFEGIALSPDARAFYTANEEALAQDGPISTLNDGTVVRVLRYDLVQGAWQPGPEVAYRTEKIFAPPIPPTEFADNGVSALLWVNQIWPDFDLLSMERSFATEVGYDVVIYGVKLAGADSTADLDVLPNPYGGQVATKVPLVHMKDIGVEADNLEGMTLGPRLPNGKPSLIVISDDNFSVFKPAQVNQFLLFELNDSGGAAAPTGALAVRPDLTAAPVAATAPAPTAPPNPRPTAAAPAVVAAAPVQLPSALPRTGTLEVGGPLLALSLLLVGAGVLLRRATASGRRR